MVIDSWLDQGALFSEDRVYRYRLWRDWETNRPTLVMIGLNPSIADHQDLDPTLRRLLGFAQAKGYGAFDVLNLYGLVSTDPRGLEKHPHPEGPENRRVIAEVLARPQVTVLAAWGTWGHKLGQVQRLRPLLWSVPMVCLGKNQDGSPRHPLYLPIASEFQTYEWP